MVILVLPLDMKNKQNTTPVELSRVLLNLHVAGQMAQVFSKATCTHPTYGKTFICCIFALTVLEAPGSCPLGFSPAPILN